MTRHLRAIEPPRGPWFLSTRAEIDAFFAERWAILSALLEADRNDRDDQLELDLEEAA